MLAIRQNAALVKQNLLELRDSLRIAKHVLWTDPRREAALMPLFALRTHRTSKVWTKRFLPPANKPE